MLSGATTILKNIKMRKQIIIGIAGGTGAVSGFVIKCHQWYGVIKNSRWSSMLLWWRKNNMLWLYEKWIQQCCSDPKKTNSFDFVINIFFFSGKGNFSSSHERSNHMALILFAHFSIRRLCYPLKPLHVTNSASVYFCSTDNLISYSWFDQRILIYEYCGIILATH